MRASDFTPFAPGRLIPTIDKQLAFVPANLPPDIELADIALAMGTAMMAIGELKGACRRLQNPYILVRPLQRQEALTSSAMEGTFTTDDNLILAEAGIETAKDESTREVFNYLDALNESLKLLNELPISHRVIRKAHELLLKGLSSARGAKKRPGEYKTEQNWIGSRNIENARFVPPPAAETQQCMDAIEKYINRQNLDYPNPLMDLALVHYQLETIHPFADGNGRVGRMMISLMAVHSGLLESPILYISPVMERYKNKYIDLMYAVSTRGEWKEWLNFFFGIVSESCKETIETVDRLIALQTSYRDIAGQNIRTASGMKLIDFLFEVPAITVNEAAEKLSVTYPAARAAIDKLVQHGILVERKGVYPKIFLAPEIIRASRPVERKNSSS